MKFRELPVVFLSFKEDNADEHFAHLKTMVSQAVRVHGVKGFDAAHRAAADAARKTKNGALPFFVTVDADNRTLPAFWDLSVEEMNSALLKSGLALLPPELRVLSWNAYNPLTGLTYGNGGLKLWGFQFVHEMRTHEQSPDTVVDFCWRPGYTQLSAVMSTTHHNGSAQQAFTAGFREGVKMPLIGGQARPEDLYVIKGKAYPGNLERLVCWCSLGAHLPFGEWSILGALEGFVQCHLDQEFPLAAVSDLDSIYKIFDAVDPNGVTEQNRELRTRIGSATDIQVPLFGARQSQFVVDLMRPFVNQHPFESETWPSKFDPKR